MADKLATDYTKQLQEELAAARAATAEALEQKAAAEKAAATAEAALKKSGGPMPIKGAYKGYKFLDGHARVRDAEGNLCDTQTLLDAANDKNSDSYAAAVAVLDRLIKINYAYFVKV